MIPRKYGPVLFVLLLSGLMSWLVSGISTVRALGWVDGFAGVWLRAWITAWAAAFPIALLAVPLARRVVDRVVARD